MLQSSKITFVISLFFIPQVYAQLNEAADVIRVIQSVAAETWSDDPRDQDGLSGVARARDRWNAFYPDSAKSADLSIDCRSSCGKSDCIRELQNQLLLDVNIFEDCKHEIVTERGNRQLFNRLLPVVRSFRGAPIIDNLFDSTATLTFVGNSCQILIGSAHGFFNAERTGLSSEMSVDLGEASVEVDMTRSIFWGMTVQEIQQRERTTGHRFERPRNKDISIVVLKEPVPNCSFFNLRATNQGELQTLSSNRQLQTASYNLLPVADDPSVPGGIKWENESSFRVKYAACGRIVSNIAQSSYNFPNVYFHNFPLAPGDSGSPLFVEEDGKFTLIGVHVSRLRPRFSDDRALFRGRYDENQSYVNVGVMIDNEIIGQYQRARKSIGR